jgi:hypothetical protein
MIDISFNSCFDLCLILISNFTATNAGMLRYFVSAFVLREEIRDPVPVDQHVMFP